MNPAPQKTGWPLFWIILLAAPVATVCVAAMGGADKIATFYVVFYGSGFSAIGCGYLVAQRITTSQPRRVLLTLSLAVGFYFLNVALCFAGCALGANLK